MTAADVDEYIAGVPEPGRSTLDEVRRRILEVIPDAEQTISYGCPAFRVAGRTVAGIAAFTHHLSYLPHSGSVLSVLVDRTRDHGQTKSSLHFPLDEPLPRPLIAELLRVRMQQAGLDPAPTRRDPRVDDYIAGLPDWQQAVCREVRKLVHEADPGVEETIKRRVRPYFVLDGNVCALLATKDHVDVFVYDPIAADPHGVINQGHGNATARAVQIRRGDVLDRAGLLALLRAVIANNRAGGWRRLSAPR